MPDYLAAAMALATAGLEVWCLLCWGATLAHLPVADRGVVLATWRASPLGPCRDLLRFYDSLVIFAALSAEAGD